MILDFKTSQRKLFSPQALANSTLPSSNKKTLQQTKGINYFCIFYRIM